jgi:hypothetical protein
MEYRSIPWDNHGEDGDPKSVKDWTINLALWFVHVLAGNNHEVTWKYNHLKKEMLKVSLPSTPDINLQAIESEDEEAESQNISSQPPSGGRKRRRSNGDDMDSPICPSQPASQPVRI